MADVIPAFVRLEELERRGDKRQHLIERSWSRRPEERFQFGERLFDGIEVRTVRRQKSDLGADRFDGVRTSGCLCTARLSSTTTSPGCNVGTRTCSTYARKLTASIGPSKTAGALTPSTRNAAITVWVSQ